MLKKGHFFPLSLRTGQCRKNKTKQNNRKTKPKIENNQLQSQLSIGTPVSSCQTDQNLVNKNVEKQWV